MRRQGKDSEGSGVKIGVWRQGRIIKIQGKDNEGGRVGRLREADYDNE